MNWTTLQLLGRWRHEMPTLLPVPLKTAAKRATGEMAGLFQQLLTATARYSELERRFYSPITLKDNSRLTARDLLETNAVLAELFTLLVDHGIDIAEQYYQDMVKRLSPEYWRLMEFAIERCGGFRRALFGLHFVVSASLWMGDHPVKTFVELFAGLSPATADKISNSDSWSLEDIFQDEDDLRRRIGEAPIVDLSGSAFDLSQVPGEARRHIEVFRSIYQARKTVVDEYVRGARANPLKYVQGVPGLPFPAVVFLPTVRAKERGYVDGLDVDDINRPRDDLYIIRAHPDGNGRHVAIAGIVDFPGGERSCVDFDLVDQSASLRYFYQRLFEARRGMFEREVDEVYEQDFSRVVLGESDNEIS